MLCYDIISGDTYAGRLSLRPRTAFIMTQIGRPIPLQVARIRRNLKRCLDSHQINSLDAGDEVTGRDFLNKIWDIILSVPVGIGIVTEEMDENAVQNVFYEIGLMQAMGKETLVIKSPNARVPSDFIRTEYIEYRQGFSRKLHTYIRKLWEQAEHYMIIAEQIITSPILSIDYVTRAYLITGEDGYKTKISQLALLSYEENPVIKALIGDPEE